MAKEMPKTGTDSHKERDKERLEFNGAKAY
jgi:hypothetical protein